MKLFAVRKTLIILANLAWLAGSSQVSINTNGSPPPGCAMLEVKSTSKGLLPPRMSTTRRNSIVSPKAGLLIYNTSLNCLEFYSNGAWFDLCGSIGLLGGAGGTCAPVTVTGAFIAGVTLSASF
jgi:hypothetical protein